MSDLIISSHNTPNPPQACVEEPPDDGSPDDCHIFLRLLEAEHPDRPIRSVRFDRSEDQFILSPTNNPELRSWFEAHSNTANIQNVLRITGSLLRTRDPQTLNLSRYFIALSHFILTGEARIPGNEGALGDPAEMAQAMLYVFADSGEDRLSRVIGRLNILRRASWLEGDEGIRDRIRWVNSILDMVPQFYAFRRHFVTEADLNIYLTDMSGRRPWTDATRERERLIYRVSRMLLEPVTAHALTRPLRYSPSLYQGIEAYRELYGEEINEGNHPEFSTAMLHALRQLTGEEEGDWNRFVDACQVADEYASAPSHQNGLSYYLSRLLHDPQGNSGLQEAIREESEEANFDRPDWFFPWDGSARPSFANVSQAFWRSFDIQVPDESEGDPQVTFNFPQFREQLFQSIEANGTTRREYVLIGMAFLRRFFGEEGRVPAIRVFFRDRFQNIRIQVSRDELQTIRRYIRQLDGMRERSQDGSEDALLGAEIAATALGALLLVGAEAIPFLREDEGLHLGLGTTGATLLGGGLPSLGVHLFAEPENRYLVELPVAAAGAVVSGLVYFLVNFLASSATNGDDGRNPVDTYGP